MGEMLPNVSPPNGKLFYCNAQQLNFCSNGCRVPRSAYSCQISVQHQFPKYSTLTPTVVTSGLHYYIIETCLVLWAGRLQAQHKKVFCTSSYFVILHTCQIFCPAHLIAEKLYIYTGYICALKDFWERCTRLPIDVQDASQTLPLKTF